MERDEITDFLKAWKALDGVTGPETNVVYRHVQSLVKPEEAPENSLLVSENLTDWFTPKRMIARLIELYPDRTFTDEQVRQCTYVLRVITLDGTFIEMENDSEVLFGFETYYPAGHFRIKRSKVLQDLLNAPDIRILCFDLGKMNDGPSFTLLELLTNEEAYEKFMAFWDMLPSYEFEADNVEELKVEIHRVDRAMEETGKMLASFTKISEKLNASSRDFASSIAEKTEALQRDVIDKQRQTLDDQAEALKSQAGTIEDLKSQCEYLMNENDSLAKQWHRLNEAYERSKKANRKLAKKLEKAQKKENNQRKRAKKFKRKFKKTNAKWKKAKKSKKK